MSSGFPGEVISVSTDVDHARETLLEFSVDQGPLLGRKVIYFNG